MDMLKPYVGKTLRIFISYSSKDNELGGKFKLCLDGYGFETFLAHEDMEVGNHFEKKIIQELEGCDIFLPLLTVNFRDSDWTSQEAGIAYELGKKVLPIKLDIDPYGFIRGIHALKINRKEAVVACDQIIDILKSDKEYVEGLKDTLIRGFVNAWSFDDANKKAKLLKGFTDFSIEQVNEIIRGALINLEIRGGFEANPFLKECIKRYGDKIDYSIVEEAQKALNIL